MSTSVTSKILTINEIDINSYITDINFIKKKTHKDFYIFDIYDCNKNKIGSCNADLNPNSNSDSDDESSESYSYNSTPRLWFFTLYITKRMYDIYSINLDFIQNYYGFLIIKLQNKYMCKMICRNNCCLDELKKEIINTIYILINIANNISNHSRLFK